MGKWSMVYFICRYELCSTDLKLTGGDFVPQRVRFPDFLAEFSKNLIGIPKQNPGFRPTFWCQKHDHQNMQRFEAPRHATFLLFRVRNGNIFIWSSSQGILSVKRWVAARSNPVWLADLGEENLEVKAMPTLKLVDDLFPKKLKNGIIKISLIEKQRIFQTFIFGANFRVCICRLGNRCPNLVNQNVFMSHHHR